VENTPEQFTAYIRVEVAKWAKVIKESGARGLAPQHAFPLGQNREQTPLPHVEIGACRRSLSSSARVRAEGRREGRAFQIAPMPRSRSISVFE
jgi:hypothetical protein